MNDAKAYEEGRTAAIEGRKVYANPYSYRLQASLYWEWMRGYREFLYGGNE